MTAMHVDEFNITDTLVRGLIGRQFPQWADLPMSRVTSVGTDNAMYRLGPDLLVRLPRIPGAVRQVETEQRWLPWLASHLPVPIPQPLGMGAAGPEFPAAWSVYQWLPGQSLMDVRVPDLSAIARTLGEFVRTLGQIRATAGPRAGGPNSSRGVPLRTRDSAVREALDKLTDELDCAAALASWEKALRVVPWDHPPVWVHGDLMPGNLLIADEHLAAVIDWGAMAIGDPAVDLMPAWNLFDPAARKIFREAVQTDGATWIRGRGWALSQALIALPYYRTTVPAIADAARVTIRAVLADSH